MGWQEYYREVAPSSIFSETPPEKIERFLQTLPQSEKEKITVVVGGFHPKSSLTSSLPNFLTSTYPSQKTNLVFLDMNFFPLTQISSLNKIRARVEEPPFPSSSIDIFLLDFTFNFMTDEQIKLFAQNVNEILSPQGLVIASSSKPVFPRPIEELLYLFSNRVKIHIRETPKVLQLLIPPLKLLYLLETETHNHEPFDVLILTKQTSLPNQQPIFESALKD